MFARTFKIIWKSWENILFQNVFSFSSVIYVYTDANAINQHPTTDVLKIYILREIFFCKILMHKQVI